MSILLNVELVYKNARFSRQQMLLPNANALVFAVVCDCEPAIRFWYEEASEDERFQQILVRAAREQEDRIFKCSTNKTTVMYRIISAIFNDEFELNPDLNITRMMDNSVAGSDQFYCYKNIYQF